MATLSQDVEELASVFQDLQKILDSKQAHLLQQLYRLHDEKKKQQETISTLRQDLKRSQSESQQLASRKQEYKDLYIKSRQEIELYKQELKKSQRKIQEYESFYKQLEGVESNLAKQLEAIQNKEIELDEREKKLQIHSEDHTSKKRENDTTKFPPDEQKR